MNDQPDIADDELVGLRRTVIAQVNRTGDGLIVEEDLRIRVRLEPDRLIPADEAADDRRAPTAGSTMSLVAALPAELAPGLSGCRPAMVTQSRR